MIYPQKPETGRIPFSAMQINLKPFGKTHSEIVYMSIRITGEDGLAALRLAQVLVESGKTHRVVEV